MDALEELVRHLRHHHEMTKEEALESARKTLAEARKDREKLDKWRAGLTENPATRSWVTAYGPCPYC